MAIKAAIALPLVGGASGLAVDVGMWRHEQSRVQVAANAAALAGAHELVRQGSTTASVTQAAERDAGLNGYDELSGATVEVSVMADDQSVAVVVSAEAPLAFAKLFLDAPPVVSAAAAAGAVADGAPICLLALEETANSAVGLVGNARIMANDCAVHVNSTGEEALKTTGIASVTAASICVAGGASGTFTPVPNESCAPLADPLASLAPPSYGACTYTNTKLNGSGAFTLNPGVYCGGIRASGSGAILFNPGIYIIKDGNLNISGTWDIDGTGVGFYITGASAAVDLTGSASLRLSAPTTGAMAGLIFFRDRTGPAGLMNKFAGGSDIVLEGSLYFPNTDVDIRGNTGMTNPAPFTIWIARRFAMNGTTDLVINSNSAVSGVPVPPGLRTMRVALTD